jgi:nitroreductase/MFS family permease
MFTFSILMMAAATTGMGLLPVYAQLGVWAPIALVFLRLLQGAAVGGEIPGAWVFVSEHVPANRIGLACGILSAGLACGLLLADAVAATGNSAFTPAEVSTWAWRLPFLFGGVLGLCSVYLRQLLRETPVFREMQARHALAAELPLKAVLRDHAGAVIVSMLLSWLLAAAIVLILLMTPSLLQKMYGVPTAAVLRANSVATLCAVIGSIASGAIIDRLGAGRFFAFGSLLFGVSAWLFYIQGATSPSLLLPLYALTGLLVGITAGVPYVMVRAFPAAVRFSGLSFSYNVAYAIFGGLTPIFVSLLLPSVPLAHLYYILAVCALGCAVGLGLWRCEQHERQTAIFPKPSEALYLGYNHRKLPEDPMPKATVTHDYTDRTRYDALMDVVESRLTTRAFDSSYVMPLEHYDMILEAARHAPSGANTQPWHFIAVTNPDLKNKIAEYFREEQVIRARLKMKFPTPDYRGLASAPGFIVVASDFRWVRAFPVLNEGSDLDKMYKENAERILLQSVAAATMSAHLAAAALGYTVWWVTAIGQEKAQRAMKPLLGIPEELSVLDIICFGPPAKPPYKRWKKSLADISSRNGFDASHFMTETQIDDWVSTKRQKVMYRDAQNVD